MLRARFAQSTRLVASTSSAPAFHSSAVAQATTMRARRAATANAKIREDREREAALSRPHIVLGHRPGDDAKWHNCDLAKILVTEQDILAAPPLPHTVPENGEVPVPKYTNYGVQEAEQSRLFETLPVLTVEAHVQSMLDHAKKENRNVPLLPQEMVPLAQVAQQSGEEKELAKAVMLARLVDLRNANARGIAYENRRRCVAAFSAPGNPNDTGRPEVQAAILTMRIRNVWDHLMRSKKDTTSRRSLRILVHQRAKILRYLKRLDIDRYDVALERLGLEREAVEGELTL